MKNDANSKLLFLIGTILFFFLFWSEKQGLNLLILDTFLLGSLFYLYRNPFDSKYVRVLFVGTLISVLMVVIHNSLIAKIVHFLSFITLVGFIHRAQLVFAAKGLFDGFIEMISAPVKIIGLLKTPNETKPKKKSLGRQLRLLPIPIGIFMVFYWVYYNANPKFAELSDQFWSNFDWLLTFDIPIVKILFFVLGMLLVAGILLKSYRNSAPSQPIESLTRADIKATGNHLNFGNIDLLNEYQMALMVFYSLCGLLLFVNLLDIGYVWFGFDPEQPQNLKQYVHSGTYLLILSIMMAMGIIIFFFRGNLNFLQKNTRLVQLAYVWIGLNLIMAVSVAIRNMRYIDFHGLAYKRIGVMLFLGLTFYGLYTMFLKVKDKKTLAFLLNKNGWAAYFCLVLACLFNWDTLITRYNLTTETKSEINVPWLINKTSDKNLFQLYEMEDALKQKPSYPKTTEMNIDDLIKRKKNFFVKKMKGFSWLSWNYSDYRNQKYLKKTNE